MGLKMTSYHDILLLAVAQITCFNRAEIERMNKRWFWASVFLALALAFTGILAWTAFNSIT